MVCGATICNMCDVQTTSQFSISSDSYYSYVPCFMRENQQESTSWHNRLGTVDSTQQWYDRQLQYQQKQCEQQRLCKSRKRKLCVRDEQPVEQLKRLREETVVTCVSSTIQEMDWQYDSNPVSIDPNIVNCSTLEQSSSMGCYWAVGNSSLISKQDHSRSDGDELNGSNTEYEKLLFTTHGCSAYHHQRAELLDNRTTTEF